MITDLDVAKKLLQLRDSAKNRKYAFDMSIKTVRNLLTRKTCAYTGVKFDRTYPNKGAFPTVDRIDSEVGYIDGNVVMCTFTVNQMKGNLENVELLKVAQALLKRYDVQTGQRKATAKSTSIRSKKA